MAESNTPARHTAKDSLGAFAAVIAVYEHRVGHACRAVSKFIPGLLKDLPEKPVVLDNACGTGAASETMIEAFPSAQIYATDILGTMVSAAKAVFESREELRSAVKEVSVMDGGSLRFDDNFFDVHIMSFGIFFFPDPFKGASEAYRTLKPGGVAVFSLWKFFGFKSILWAIQDLVKPSVPLEELPLMESWTDGTKLTATLQEGGFKDVKLTAVDEVMWGQDQDDFEKVLVENFDALVSRNWTAEERAKLPSMTSQVVKSMSPQDLIHQDGKVGVKMTAWIAVAKK